MSRMFGCICPLLLFGLRNIIMVIIVRDSSLHLVEWKPNSDCLSFQFEAPEKTSLSSLEPWDQFIVSNFLLEFWYAFLFHFC